MVQLGYHVEVSSSVDDKRQRILAAALVLFGRYGFRRTSVDLIAAEAGIAKGTLYAAFPSKEDVFRGACELVADTILARARAALEHPTTQARLAALLEAKFVYLYDLLHASPHAAELLASQTALGADVIEPADSSYRALISDVLEAAQFAGDVDLGRAGFAEPAAAAAYLIRAGHGADQAADDAATHRANLHEAVRVFWAAVTPDASAPKRR